MSANRDRFVPDAPPRQPSPTTQGVVRIARRALGRLRGEAGAAPGDLRLAPSPPEVPLLGHLLELKSRRLAAFGHAWRSYGDVVRVDLLGITAHLLTHPDHVRHVFVDKHRVYTKKTRGVAMLRQVLGEGLLIAEGERWRRQRRIAQPAFHRKRIAALGEAMVQKASATADRWEAHAREGRAIDLAEEMTRLTLEIVVEALLGSSVALDPPRIGAAVSRVIEETNRRIGALYVPPKWMPTPRNRAFLRDLATLDEAVFAILKERRARSREPDQGGDLLDMLLAARDEESGEGMSDVQLRDELMTLFLAGHETTSNALAWTFYLLGRHPEVERRLLEELDGVLGARPPEVADLAALPYLEQVLKEAMRLYPPAWTLARALAEDDEIDGYHLPAGSLVLLSPYYIHRHPDFWSRPEAFDPDRFTKERSEGRHRHAYLPFGAGHRLCIGEGFAMMEAKLILATLLRRHRIVLAPGRPVVPEPLVTLRPSPGVWATLRARG